MKTFRVISAAIYSCFLINAQALASEALEETSVDVRPITRNSTDVFDVLTHFIKATASYEAQDFRQSYASFSIVVMHDSENVQALMGLGNSALEINETKTALKTFELLARLPLTPDESLERYSGHVLAAIKTHQKLNAETHLIAALEEVPSDARLWNALGQHYDNKSRWEDSFESYKKAHENGFSKAGFHNNLGMSFLRQQKYKGAISNFTYAAALKPRIEQYDNNRRYALLMSGNYIEGLKALSGDKATTLLSDAGKVAIQKDDFALARTLLEKAIEISPTYNQQAIEALEKLPQLN